MSYFRTGDPLDDFDRLDRESSLREKRFPTCCHCGYKITDRKMFDVDGNYYHIDCAKDEFLKLTSDYIEEEY